jgi:tetratricopeptide (TPR) repeat protein
VPSALIRSGLLLAALVALAWLALSYRAVKLEAEGEAVLERVGRVSVEPEEVERAREAFRAASRLNADLDPLVKEGLLLATTGRRDEAATLAERATKSEPENFNAWYLALAAAQDRRHAEQARRRLSHLNARLELR